MDINLPDISGFEALRLLRADPLTAHIPAVALSANAMPRDIGVWGKLQFLRGSCRCGYVAEILHSASIFFARYTKICADAYGIRE